MSLVNIRAKEVLLRISAQDPGFAIVLSLLVKTMAKFLHEYTYIFGGLISIKKQTSNVLDSKIFLQLGAM